MKYNFYIFKIAFLLLIYLLFCYLTAIANEADSRPVFVISPGDQLLITVFGHETELTALVVVRPDGMITYPIVGEIKAAELTIAQLTSAIREKLQFQGFYIDPQVTVQLKEPTMILIYVFGAVMDPGQKKFARAANVIEVLAASGRPEESADLSKARIIKKGKIIPIDLDELLKSEVIEQSIVSHEIMMDDGDVLIIPYAFQINIIGNVNRPGRYYAKSKISIIQALALAGGFLENADLRRINVIREDGTIDIVDATKAWETSFEHNLIVFPGDSIIVPEKNNVKILGNVKNQGLFPVDGEISLIEALALAGVDKDSNLKNLRIIKSDGKKVSVDVSEAWRQGENFTEQKLSPGDTLIVPGAFKINWTAVSVSVAVASTVLALFLR